MEFMVRSTPCTAIIFLIFSLLTPTLLAERNERVLTLKDGIGVGLNPGYLRIRVLNERSIRVIYSENENASSRESLVLLPQSSSPEFKLAQNDKELTLTTAQLKVQVSYDNGMVSFFDRQGQPLLREASDSRRLSPSNVMGEATFTAQQFFHLEEGEALYGLGQHQDGVFNRRDVPTQLRQANTQTGVPVLVSSRGYAILWDNPSLTEVNPADESISLHPQTGEGFFTSGPSGDYGFILRDGDLQDRLKLSVGDRVVFDISNLWVPYSASGKLKLEANTRYQVKAESHNQKARLFMRQPSSTFGFRSEVADAIDYVFFYGPDPESAIKTYSQVTGHAPMFPKWAYGFLQSRERYSTQQQLLEAAAEYRRRGIPLDAMVQDWQYWGSHGWNAMTFDAANYPDPAGMLKTLHEQNLHFIISVWSRFDLQTPVAKALAAESLLVPGTDWLDPFNPRGREVYWDFMKRGLFDLGVDGWWLDATEPDGDVLFNKQVYSGSGQRLRNAYPLHVNRAVYEGQRASAPDKRVMNLSRSAFAGQQRYAAASWSGDIAGTWDSYRRQIPAGLSFALSGLPYWTTDIGGFFRPSDQYTNPDYQELLVRWFQYGAFNPIFRVHGYMSETEIWKYGSKAEAAMIKANELRYRLMPYIYSLAAQANRQGAPILRALLLDFPQDPSVKEISDQFMFGSSLLVNPVIYPGVTSRWVYLPQGSIWIDFWTAERHSGGQWIEAAAPFERLPLFVKAGSILPMGPLMQHVYEKAADPIELRIYRGQDGDFVLYEDQGDGYGYESGAAATISLHWDDMRSVLELGERKGSFPGMLQNRSFHVVLVDQEHGTASEGSSSIDKTVSYDGRSMSVSLGR